MAKRKSKDLDQDVIESLCIVDVEEAFLYNALVHRTTDPEQNSVSVEIWTTVP